MPLEPGGQFISLGEIANLTKMSPVDHRGRQAKAPAVLSEAVEGGVGGGIVGLAGMAEHTRKRREQHELVKVEAE